MPWAVGTHLWAAAIGCTSWQSCCQRDGFGSTLGRVRPNDCFYFVQYGLVCAQHFPACSHAPTNASSHKFPISCTVIAPSWHLSALSVDLGHQESRLCMLIA